MPEMAWQVINIEDEKYLRVVDRMYNHLGVQSEWVSHKNEVYLDYYRKRCTRNKSWT
jgi:hypothetical protein